MRFSRNILTFVFAIIILTAFSAINVPAQTSEDDQLPEKRPVVVYYYYHDPFWAWDRYWYDPYANDPYLRERRQMYYRREAVRDAREDLNEHREEYNSDGVITAEERRELNDDYADLDEALAKLEEYDVDRGYYDRM